MKLLKTAAIFAIMCGCAFAEPYVVKSGDTLSAILAESYSSEEIIKIAKDLKAQEPSFVLRTGMKIDMGTENCSISLAADKEALIYREEGVATVSVVNYEHEVLPTVVSGTIKSSLFNAVAEIGEDAELAAQLARIYEWEFDFFRDLHPGDNFTVLLEKKFVNGRYMGYGRILAADFVVQGRHHRAFYYHDGKTSGYYDNEGRALERGFLRVPLSYSRISSRFTDNRLHPVLGVNRPHYGVDYAAPIGTPVMATANGTVVKRAYSDSNGNYVQLKHGNGYTTYYLHLNGFAKGVSVGAQISQGQVIGYVGKTGYATGPHLDYRIQHNGSWINPLNFVAESPKLTAENMVEFMQLASARNQTLRQCYQYAGNIKPALRP